MSKVSRFKPEMGIGSHRYYLGNNYSFSNYIKCDGSIVSQSAYPELFSEIGLINDGVANWTTRTTPASGVYDLTYGNGLYVYGGAGGAIATSTDAITWTARTSATSSAIFTLTYGNGLYVYGGQSGALGTSTDGITWTARSSGVSQSIFDLIYANGLYVFCGGSGSFNCLRTSTDAITWTARTLSNSTLWLRALAYGNGLYVVAGDTSGSDSFTSLPALLYTSTDGVTWTQRNSGTTRSINGIAYGNGLFVHAGGGVSSSEKGVICTSTDGITWTLRSSNIPSTIITLAYSGGKFRASTSLKYYESTDGITWREKASISSITSGVITVNQLNVTAKSSASIITAPEYTYNTSTEFVLPNTADAFPNDFVKSFAYIKYK